LGVDRLDFGVILFGNKLLLPLLASGPVHKVCSIVVISIEIRQGKAKGRGDMNKTRLHRRPS